MWNCGEAIQVVSDAVVRNNLILNSTNGITAAPHAQVAQMRNVMIVNNTIYGHSTCVFVRWSGAAQHDPRQQRALLPRRDLAAEHRSADDVGLSSGTAALSLATPRAVAILKGDAQDRQNCHDAVHDASFARCSRGLDRTSALF
jgi:hypothetical protein